MSSPSTQEKAWEPTHTWKACISGHTHHPVSEGRWAKVQAWKEVQISYSSTLILRAGPPNYEQHDISCSYFVFFFYCKAKVIINRNEKKNIWGRLVWGHHHLTMNSKRWAYSSVAECLPNMQTALINSQVTSRHPSELRSSDSHWCQPEVAPRL